MEGKTPSAGVYVYCIARAEPFLNGAIPFRSQSIGGPDFPVYAIPFMDLVAIVSDSPSARYDVSRQNTMAHELVVEEAMKHSDVLPVRFGTIGKNADLVMDRLLKRKFGEFHYLLQSIQQRVELGLKVFWNRERLFKDITENDAQIRQLRDTIVSKPPEETHYLRIQLGQLTEEAITRQRAQDAEAILEDLRPLAVETKVNKILTDTMILNAAFLVDKSREGEFDAKVNALDEAQAGRLILKYVGALPPYNFVNVVVRWEED